MSAACCRLCRARRHHQFLLPARRLASGRAGACRPSSSALPASASPTAIRWPAWCARMCMAKEHAACSIAGRRAAGLRRRHARHSGLSAGPRRLGTADALAHRRQAARREGRLHPASARSAASRSKGSISSSCRRRGSMPPRLSTLLRTLEDSMRSQRRVWLAASMLYRGDDARRLARLARIADGSARAAHRRQRRALSRARAPRAAGRRHLHPRARDHRRGRPAARSQCRAASEAAAGNGAAVPRLRRRRSRRRSAFSSAAISRSTSCKHRISRRDPRTATRRRRRRCVALAEDGAQRRYPDGMPPDSARDPRPRARS